MFAHSPLTDAIATLIATMSAIYVVIHMSTLNKISHMHDEGPLSDMKILLTISTIFHTTILALSLTYIADIMTTAHNTANY